MAAVTDKMRPPQIVRIVFRVGRVAGCTAGTRAELARRILVARIMAMTLLAIRARPTVRISTFSQWVPGSAT